MTPELKVVSEFHDWFVAALGNVEKLRPGMSRYFTEDTDLYEPTNYPWGGRSVGHEGWLELCRIIYPIYRKMADLYGPIYKVSAPTFYQQGNVVLKEFVVTINGTTRFPQPCHLGVIGKFTIEQGRIRRVDQFHTDPVAYLNRLSGLGLLS